jgi:hypothetical protein
MGNAEAGRHQVQLSGVHDRFTAEAVFMDDLAGNEPRYRLQSDVRMRSDVHGLLCGEVQRTVAIQKTPSPDRSTLPARQRSKDMERSEFCPTSRNAFNGSGAASAIR